MNPEHLALVKTQKTYKEGGGFICANANCGVTGLCVALRPLMSHFNVEAVIASTLQAVSGRFESQSIHKAIQRKFNDGDLMGRCRLSRTLVVGYSR